MADDAPRSVPMWPRVLVATALAIGATGSGLMMLVTFGLLALALALVALRLVHSAPSVTDAPPSRRAPRA